MRYVTASADDGLRLQRRRSLITGDKCVAGRQRVGFTENTNAACAPCTGHFEAEQNCPKRDSATYKQLEHSSCKPRLPASYDHDAPPPPAGET